MAPGYRNQNRSGRQNRTGYVDHDVFEGLPVRQWRRDYITVLPPPTQEAVPQNDIWAVELPHGMPKDSHLLPQHSQDLLRAARSGRIYKRPAPAEEEEADVEAILGDKPEKKDDDPKDRGWTAKTWKPIPRHLEGPDVEYLAKRRKGLITVTSKPAPSGPTLTKATVKRIDAAGNEYIQDVVIPQGQKVEGEVISQTTIQDPGANSLGDGLLAPTPQKRKGPPKGRKLKGPGRGRKKKVVAPTSVPETAPVDGVVQSVEGVDGVSGVGTDGIKIENAGDEPISTPANNEDTEMADGSTHDSDDEEGEEGEEGDEDDEGSVDNQSSPSKPPRPLSNPPNNLPSTTEVPHIPQPDTEMGETEATARPPILHIQRDSLELKAGSPLKNVALTTSTLTSPLESPSATAAAPFFEPAPAPELNPILEDTEPTTVDEAMPQQSTDLAPPILPPPPPEPTVAEEIASTEVRREEEEEEEMLLDIVENANNANIGGGEALPPTEPEVPVELVQELEIPAPEPEPITPEGAEAPVEQQEESAPLEPTVANKVEEVHAEVPQAVEDDDDNFPDLLGGLEKQLNDPVAETTTVRPVVEAPVEAPTETVGDIEKTGEVVEEKTDGV